MGLPIAVVDAFTAQAFRGNPAAVCRLDEWPDDLWLGSVAAELNLSETAFLVARPHGGHDLRWFTPTVEVELCGHATLASAHVLARPARFHTRSGVLTCERAGDGTWWLDFPADPPVPGGRPEAASAALGARPVWLGAGRFDWLVELADASVVRGLEPDLEAVAELGRRGVIVTAAGDRSGVDFVSRFFGPNAGVPEDPVTGSAHCTLGCYWTDRLGRRELVGHQVSARGGEVRVQVRGGRVGLGGRAVTVWEGTLLVGPDG